MVFHKFIFDEFRFYADWSAERRSQTEFRANFKIKLLKDKIFIENEHTLYLIKYEDIVANGNGHAVYNSFKQSYFLDTKADLGFLPKSSSKRGLGGEDVVVSPYSEKQLRKRRKEVEENGKVFPEP
jgi:hypothetical protein